MKRLLQRVKWVSSQYKYIVMGICMLICLFVGLDCQERITYRLSLEKTIQKAGFDIEKLRDMHFEGDSIYRLQQYCEKTKEDFIGELTMRVVLYDYEVEDRDEVVCSPVSERLKRMIITLPLYQKLYGIYESIFNEIRYFPIPKDLAGGEYVTYEDGFGDARSYGGERKHEGTDLIPSMKERGYFPVVSICDGTVSNVGWLELGGWRIGIESKSRGYFYYAHLDSYAKGLKEGDPVRAGELLGFMGDTGYGKKEGTRGKFIVHLHFGIYTDIDGKQVSVNPYWVLKYLEHRELAYYY